MMHGKKSKMKTSGGMPMVKKDGKMVPSFAADGVGKMKAGGAAGMMKPKMAAGGGMMKPKMAAGGGMMKPKMAAGGGMMRSKMGMSGGIGEEVTVRGSGAARSSKARIY
jgi:hypothetical protein